MADLSSSLSVPSPSLSNFFSIAARASVPAGPPGGFPGPALSPGAAFGLGSGRPVARSRSCTRRVLPEHLVAMAAPPGAVTVEVLPGRLAAEGTRPLAPAERGRQPRALVERGRRPRMHSPCTAST